MSYFNYRKFPGKTSGRSDGPTTRKSYGTTWWGKQWLNAFNQIDYSNRLPRGKTYANKGAVSQVKMEENTISALVEGSGWEPYEVLIKVPKFDGDTQKKLVQLVSDNPFFLSKLLNRELPPELDAACRQKGIHIFPQSWRDLKGKCSCPDSAVPCKHLAAVLYIIANEIDKNPFVVFDLHAFDLVKALEQAGFTQGGSEDIPIPKAADLYLEIAEKSLKPAKFDEAIFAELDFSKIPDLRENLLRLLPEKPVFYPEGDFKKIMAAVYNTVAKGVAKDAIGLTDKVAENDIKVNFIEHIALMLHPSGTFAAATLLDARQETLHAFEQAGTWWEFLQHLPAATVAHLAPEFRGLHVAAMLAAHLAQQGAFVPQLLRLEEDTFAVRFIPALLNNDVRHLVGKVRQLLPVDSVFYMVDGGFKEANSEDVPNAILSAFLNFFIQKYHIAGQITLPGTKKAPVHTPEARAIEHWFFSGLPAKFSSFENRSYPKAIQLWLNRFFIAEKDFVPVFEVAEPEGSGRFEVGVRIEDKQKPFDAPVPLDKVFAEAQYAAMRLDALRDLSLVTEFFPSLSRLIASKGAEILSFNSRSFVDVFFNALPVIRLLGIKILLPKSLQKLHRPQASMKLSGKGKVSGTGILSFAGMTDFDWQIALGQNLLSPAAFAEMVKNLGGIVRIADEYVYLNDTEIAALLEKIDKMPEPTGPKLLQIALAGEYQGVPVQLDEAARTLITQLLQPDAVPLPNGLNATLRPYQQRGYEWLYKNTRLGFGSLIADDMGLGKTLQVIAALLKMKQTGVIGVDKDSPKAMVVVPTTLLTNWVKEIARFSPALLVHTYHGPGRTMKPLSDADLLLTTYGTVRSELPVFQKQHWAVLVIDEAQNIKNLETAQTKAVRKIAAPIRIAMTGTPVENRMSEYYSIFDFVNGGYLGSLKSFTAEFARPIERDRNQESLNLFKKITEPFLLRRLKTDKSIINDLPDKIETDQYCPLTPEQAALYQNVVEESLRAISGEKKGDIKREGLVLKMLTALKQVCNHPAQYLKKRVADPALSGKSQLLLELLAQILDNGEKALIFTQYAQMGELIVPMLRAELGIEAAFLHGGVSRKLRDEMVENFQQNHSSRVLILSLKAGGTGLNLTAASNVIHYDLWWNPAVEAQATDRAFRIGQQRNVQVHRFITQGSFEEKINTMINTKKDLANLTVATGEKWIGELSDGELRELVRL
jgi:uncharacterized Zn finger protein/superfamily II DNA or RNA helicase